jgi:outer membrane protein assembly factor BamE
MKSTTILLSLIFILFSSACYYKTPIQQGNVLKQEEVDEVKPGMNKRQIAIILGTPAIADPFNQDRWDYINTIRYNGNTSRIKRLTLYFENDKLIRTEGNYFPKKYVETIEE